MLKGITKGSLLLSMVSLTACSQSQHQAENSLLIPTLIDSLNEQTIVLNIQKSEHEFYSGVKSDTMGINGNYLGPTIKLHKGKTARLKFTNHLAEATTMHGHGLHVDGEIDGGPQQKINPGESQSIVIPVQQQAGLSWYHPHLMGKTAEHVHAGLAGLYIIEDDNARSLNLPDNYGINDIPLIIQDRDFSEGKMLPYAAEHEALIDGLRQDTLVINGTVNPYKNVPKSWIRLRLLNGSNARFYRFYFSDDKPFYKIATEGGFLNKPVLIDDLTMAPGERNEVMVDLSDTDTIKLMAEFIAADVDDQPFFLAWFNSTASVVELRTDQTIQNNSDLPERLNNIQYFTESEQANALVRTLSLEMDDDDRKPLNQHELFSINGKPMDMSRIDQRVTKGQPEIWRITGEMMPHPFHVHGVSFQILKQLGEAPAEADRGWKDTVIVGEKPTEIMMKFNHTADEKTPYMYHCHILEHEDAGMMGQFTVR